MASSVPPVPSAVSEQDATSSPVSIGAGVALTGICATSFLLVAFLTVFNYTDLLVANSGASSTSTNSLDALMAELILLAITFSPMIVSYKLCAMIIDKI